MASLFRNLFGHKKSHSRGDEDNNGNEPPMERDQPRRSYRSSSKSRGPAARFQDDSMLPPTAAYHSQNVKKLQRGPKSCPGEYVEESGGSSSRHFAIDYNRHEPKEHRRRSGQLASSSSMMTSTSSSHYRPNQRWETSEYGSENTSPIGYQRHQQQRRGQNRGDENEEDEEDEETEEEATYEKKYRYQEVKRKIRAHYEERLFNYERTQRNDHRQIKELEKEKDELLKMLLQSNAKLEKEKKKSEYFRRKWQESEQQMFPPSFAFQQTPQFQPVFPFGSTSQRYSFMGAPMHPISTSNTPTTSAMDTTHGGAGESLVPASDVSFMTPLTVASIPTLPPSVPTSSASHPQPTTCYYHDDEEDQDETKNFRDVEDVELPRGCSNTLINDEEEIMNQSTVSTLQEEGKDSGFSTTPDDVKKAMEQLEVK